MMKKLFTERFAHRTHPVWPHVRSRRPAAPDPRVVKESSNFEGGRLCERAAPYLNRLVRSENRMHELVIYDYLAQLYARRIARAKHNTTPA